MQALGFVSGILVIRLLPVEEYAYYILANTMLGIFTVIGDAGISQGVMSEGGKVWQNEKKLGIVLSTGLDLRRKFALITLLIAIPFFLFLLFRNDAGWLTSILIILSLIPAFFAALTDNLLQIIPKLHQNVKPLQRNQVEVSIGRLFLLFSTIFFFPFAFIAVLANGLPRIYGNFKLKKIAKNHVETDLTPNEDVKNQILKVVKRILPGSIYYAFSGQITIWFISIMGQTQTLAQLGALGRFSVILTLINTVVAYLAVPRFSRMVNDREKLFKIVFKLFFALIFIISIVIFICYLLSTPIISILGKQYENLEYEFLLSMINAGITFFVTFFYSLSSSKGWILNPVASILLGILIIISGLLIFDLSTLVGTLKYQIYLALLHLIMHSSYIFYKIAKVT